MLRAGGTGLELARSDAASESLLADLRSDKGMGWVPDEMWFSYLRVNTAAKNLDYDLAVSTHPGVLPSARMVGIGLPGGPAPAPSSGFPAVAGQPRSWAALLAGLTALAVRARRRSDSVQRREARPGAGACGAVGALAFMLAVMAYGVVGVVQSSGASGDASPTRPRPRSGDGAARRARQPLHTVAHPRTPAHRVDVRSGEPRLPEPRVHHRWRRRARPPRRWPRGVPPADPRRGVDPAARDRRDDVRSPRAGEGAVRLPPPRPLRLRHDGLRDRGSDA